MIMSFCFSSMLMASENCREFSIVARNGGSYAHYSQSRVCHMGLKSAPVYSIFLYDSEQKKTSQLCYRQPIVGMKWDSSQVLHVDLADGSKRTYSLNN